jgi:transcriptional regulator with XRE-family HTH domain
MSRSLLFEAPESALHHGSGRHRVAVAFGHVLKANRCNRHLSQEALAERCNFDRTYPSLLERGLRTPTLGVLLDLAHGLEIPVERLVAETVALVTGVPARNIVEQEADP